MFHLPKGLVACFQAMAHVVGKSTSVNDRLLFLFKFWWHVISGVAYYMAKKVGFWNGMSRSAKTVEIQHPITNIQWHWDAPGYLTSFDQSFDATSKHGTVKFFEPTEKTAQKNEGISLPLAQALCALDVRTSWGENRSWSAVDWYAPVKLNQFLNFWNQNEQIEYGNCLDWTIWKLQLRDLPSVKNNLRIRNLNPQLPTGSSWKSPPRKKMFVDRNQIVMENGWKWIRFESVCSILSSAPTFKITKLEMGVLDGSLIYLCISQYIISYCGRHSVCFVGVCCHVTVSTCSMSCLYQFSRHQGDNSNLAKPDQLLSLCTYLNLLHLEKIIPTYPYII